MGSPVFGDGGGHVYTQPAPFRARTVPFIKVNAIDDQSPNTVFQNNGQIIDDTTGTDQIRRVMLLLKRPIAVMYGFRIQFSSAVFMTETVGASNSVGDFSWTVRVELVLDTKPWDPTTLTHNNGNSLTTRNARTFYQHWRTTQNDFINEVDDVDYELGDSGFLEYTDYIEDAYKVSAVPADVAAGFKIQGVKITVDGTGYNDPNGWNATGIVKVNNTGTDPETTFSLAII